MLFNSVQFAIFFVIVYSLYLIVNHKWQNRMLLVASYVFYGSWDWRFLSLIIISTVLDYFCGIKIHESSDPKRKKLFLLFSVSGNLGILGFFKYYDFFASSLEVLLQRVGISIHPHFLHIILPLGISFYTFQTMSYTIDVYREKMEPTRKFLDFALFVSFFPQLIAGPIERAKHLLPQILKPRKLTLQKFYDGCYLIFWGLYLKMFVADNLAKVVDPVFAASAPYQGEMVLLALYAFAFQIFCDFAGYSIIARGLGKCMGFDIMVNFDLPYFAVNPRDFWHRWHISLSTWLRDYLYIPLGGNRKGTLKTYRNIAITMLLGGLWHGAAWTFIIWGAYQGILLVIHRLISPIIKKVPSPDNFLIAKGWFIIRVIIFFHLICLGWLFFRAQNGVKQVWEMLKSLIFNFHFTYQGQTKEVCFHIMFYTGLLLMVQLFQYYKDDLMAITKTNMLVRITFYSACALLLLLFGAQGGKEFIYFVF